ncbi:MAG: FRG domain-containing protein, partial [Terracidiphilus sp.]
MESLLAKGTVSEITSQLEEKFHAVPEVWFRGQSKFDYDLRPGIFRQGTSYGYSFHESKMYREFQRRHTEVQLERDDVSEWLPIMQHYGLPTRLLDWTTNLLVGLYFCCSRRREEDGALFAFNPSTLIRDYTL